MSRVELRYNIGTELDLDCTEIQALGHTSEMSRKTPYEQQELEMITQELLHELFYYDEETGLLTRKIANSNYVKVGDIVGTKTKGGYLRTRVNGKDYLVHRLIWLFVHGTFPKIHIDHINHNGIDNRLCNLREADDAINGRNRSLKNTNTSGINGVCYDRVRGKWLAQIKYDYKNIYLGRFIKKEDAIKARKEAEIKYGFHKNHGKDKYE